MKICWWNAATWLLTGLLMFTVGLIAGAVLAAGVLLFPCIFILIAAVWLVLLILVRIFFFIHCRVCWDDSSN